MEAILLLGLMAIVLIGSPGPAAMALAATGAAHKPSQGLPLIAGLVSGVLITGLLTSLGLHELLSHWPEARIMMQICGAGFLLIMALLMLRQPVSESKRPQFGYVSGLLMNLLNPKAYAVFMLLISKYLPAMSSQILALLVLETVALLATLIVAFGWLLLGTLLGHHICKPAGKRRLQQLFTVLMLVFILPVLFTLPG